MCEPAILRPFKIALYEQESLCTMSEAEFMPTISVDVPSAALRKGGFEIVYCVSPALVIIRSLCLTQSGPVEFEDDINLKIIAYIG